MEIANFFLLNFRYIIVVLLFILIVFSLKKRLKENEKVIRKYISEHPIDIGIWFAIIPVIILGLAYFFTSIVNLDQWASFATYTSLGLSITTVIFVLMTYQIQSKSSTVLQFDSTYFQWMGIFLDAVSKDQKSFEEYYKKTAKVLLEGGNDSFPINTFLQNRECLLIKSRIVHGSQHFFETSHWNGKCQFIFRNEWTGRGVEHSEETPFPVLPIFIDGKCNDGCTTGCKQCGYSISRIVIVESPCA